MAVLSEATRTIAEGIKARYPSPRSALMPLLYLVQAEEGWVSRDGLQEVAEILGLTTAEVESVATFYTMLKLQPSGKYILSICTNVSCAVRGGKALFDQAKDELGPGCEGMTDDGMITLHEEECLGACDAAPLVQVNFANYDRVSPDDLRALIEALRRDEPPAPSRGVAPRNLKAASRTLAGLGGEDA
jgi:NADH-quinone oxidoreductase subunit E